MGTVHRSLHNDINWLTAGPIGPYVDAFKQHLADGRYAASPVAGYVSNIAHFAQWVRGKRLRLHRIDEASIAEFLDQHLPHCRCVRPIRHDRGDHSAALGHLLFVLRARGAVALPTVSTTPVDEGCRCSTHSGRTLACRSLPRRQRALRWIRGSMARATRRPVLRATARTGSAWRSPG